MESDWRSAFFLNLRRCQAFGWWKIESGSVSKRFAYAVYRIISVTFLKVFTLLQLIDLYEAAADLDKISANVCGTSVSVVSMSKVFVVLYNSRHMDDLQKSLADNLGVGHVGRDKSDISILLRGSDEILRLTKIFFGLVIPTVFFWSILPLIDESGVMKLPLRLWIPYDWDESPVYEIFYAYQIIGLWLFAVAILSNDLIIFGFIIQICSQYEILEKNIRRLDEFCASDLQSNPRGERTLIKEIKKNIAHHQEILRRINQLHLIYEESFFVHFSGAVPLICVIGFNIITGGRRAGFSTLVITQIAYVGSTLFDIFFFCYYGERLRQKGLKISEATYDCVWYRMDRDPRMLLSIIMARAQRSPSLKAGSVITINLRAFLHTLRNSYNILAVMNQTARR